MQISPVTMSLNNAKNIKKSSNTQLSFKGQTNDKESSKIPYCQIDMQSFLNNPMVNLYTQLIKDGFKTEELKKTKIFQTINMNPDFDTYMLMGLDRTPDNYINQIKAQMFDYKPKSQEDIKAMIKLYKQLREKFASNDVIQYNKETQKLMNDLKKMFNDAPCDENEPIRGMMLHILSATNSKNGNIAEALLNDENFNNLDINTALLGIDSKEKSAYGQKVLQIAQKIGYNKEFSFHLAIMISEANQENIKMIERLIEEEQDFFINNEEFTTCELMDFLRFENPLTLTYISDNEIPMETIQELMEMDEELDEDLDDFE